MRDSWDRGVLRRTFGRFATGVTVITTRAQDGRSIGLTANSFNTLSLDPALVLWSLGTAQGSSAIFRNSSHFAINILSAEQIELSRRFASPVADRFAGVDYVEDGLAAPLIKGCAAWLVCRRREHIEFGDHLLFIGEVEVLGTTNVPPLLFHDCDYTFTRGATLAQA
ncbi:flavin reductase family protein [Paraburkholderia susongensis]|uniref:flavin reductase family protein n=1 Tax=Paraburkholderia susongensis TaxID=1515439 RepID=UPI001FCA2623|nr:flavin reductase family protein [Paraburkholderia susongensis]